PFDPAAQPVGLYLRALKCGINCTSATPIIQCVKRITHETFLHTLFSHRKLQRCLLAAGLMQVVEFPSWLAGYTPTVTTPAQGAITVIRAPHDPSALPTNAEINGVMATNNFAGFTAQLEGYHDSVHVWVGGTMSMIPTAPCDPVFFMHHANID